MRRRLMPSSKTLDLIGLKLGSNGIRHATNFCSLSEKPLRSLVTQAAQGRLLRRLRPGSRLLFAVEQFSRSVYLDSLVERENSVRANSREDTREKQLRAFFCWLIFRVTRISCL